MSSSSSSSQPLSLKTLTFDEHHVISALNLLTKGGKPAVSVDFLQADMNTRFIKDVNISHIPPKFPTTKSLTDVLQKFINAGWARFEKSKSTYSIIDKRFDLAVSLASVESPAPDEILNRKLVIGALWTLHNMAGDKESLKLCHPFHKICYLVPLSASTVAYVLHEFDGHDVSSDGLYRVRKIQAKSASKDIIASKAWFWGIEKGVGTKLEVPFEVQAIPYIAAERLYNIEMVKYNKEISDGNINFPKPVQHQVPFPTIKSTTKYAKMWVQDSPWDYYDESYERDYVLLRSHPDYPNKLLRL